MRLALFLRYCLVLAVAIALGGQTLGHAQTAAPQAANHCADAGPKSHEHAGMAQHDGGASTAHSGDKTHSGKAAAAKCSVLCCAILGASPVLLYVSTAALQHETQRMLRLTADIPAPALPPPRS